MKLLNRVRKLNLGRKALLLIVGVATVLGFWRYLILPSAQDFVSQARLCNDEFLVCASARHSVISVNNLGSTKLYNLESLLPGVTFHRPAEFEVSKRSPFLIVRVNSNPDWILVRLGNGDCHRVVIPPLDDMQLIDDFDADQTFLVGNDADGKQFMLILSNDDALEPQAVLDSASIRFRAAVKKDTMYFESNRFLAANGCLVEEIGNQLARRPSRKLVLTNGITGEVVKEISIVPPKPLGLVTVGNRRLLAVSRKGHITHSWTVFESGDLNETGTGKSEARTGQSYADTFGNQVMLWRTLTETFP